MTWFRAELEQRRDRAVAELAFERYQSTQIMKNAAGRSACG